MGHSLIKHYYGRGHADVICHCFCFQAQTCESEGLCWKGLFLLCFVLFFILGDVYSFGSGLDNRIIDILHPSVRMALKVADSVHIFFFSNPLISELIVECIRCYCANTMVSRFLSGSPISSLLIWLSHPRMPYTESALV